MYLLNAEVKISWVLEETSSTLVFSDLDLILIDPEGTITYLDSANASIINFTAPGVSSTGLAEYLFTPDKEGLWKIRLVVGISSSYKVLSKTDLYVLDNTNVVKPFSPEIGNPIPYDISYFLQGYPVGDEIVGSFIASRDVVIPLNSTKNQAVAEVAPSLIDQTFIIRHNNNDIGTIVFSVGQFNGVITIPFLLLNEGDKLHIVVAPNPIDLSIKDIAITLVGCSSISVCDLL